MDLTSCHPHNCSRLWEFFSYPSEAFQEYFSVWFSWSHHLGIIHSSFELSFSKSYRCIVQVYSSQLMISLFSCIQVPLKYLYSFSNSSQWIVSLLLSFSILTMVRSRVLFLRYHIDSFVLSNPTGGSLKTFSSLCYIYLNPFYENKLHVIRCLSSI